MYIINYLRNPPNLIYILFSIFLASNSFAAIDIVEDGNAFHVTSDKYSWLISKNEFNVIKNASVNGNTVIDGGQVSVDFLGSTSIFGVPSQFLTGQNWVELRGWADESKNLWYIARYQFYDNNPLVALSLTVTDRHDSTKTEGQWHASWKQRIISNLHIKLDSTATLPDRRYIQHNSYSGASTSESFVEVISRTGVPFKWKKSHSSTNQLRHPNVGNSENKVIWHLKHDGNANLEASFTPFPAGRPDLIASNISYIVKHADGIDTVNVDLQNTSPIQLGQYNFDEDSTVTLVDTGNIGVMLADSITIKSLNNTVEKIIQLGEKLEDNVLQVAPLTLLVQDLWKNHPIEVYSTANNIGIKAIKDPTILMGGMGKTFDIGISIEGNANNALALFNSPPLTTPDLSNWNNIDGLIVSSPEFLGLLGKINQIVDNRDNLDDNFGWKNWGDYQIGNNYTNSSGVPIEDWASLQFDLPTGLLLTWLHTKDPQLWLRAKAAIRHGMDIDIVKFMPFRDKYAGATHRKGTCPAAESHICSEPVIDFSFNWRGLLLYHLITGEEWAKDVAQMQIDNSAYIAKTRKSFLLEGGRPAAWVLRALIYGEKFFPEGTRYLSANTETPMPAHSSYRAILDDVMTDLIASIIDIKKFPGHQPIWAGQGIETLAEYHQITGSNDAKTAITLAVDYLITSSRDNNGVLEVMYNENTQTWVPLSNYGWLWLSSVAYAYDLTKDQKYLDFGDKLYQQSIINFKNEKSIRPWTSVIGFPWLYIKRMNEDSDGDSIFDYFDNCPADVNFDQIDTDGDGIGDVCDLVDDSDVIAPVITLNGSSSISLVIDSTYIESGATAIDDKDGDISGQIVIDSSNINTSTAGTYTVTYNVSDAAENTADEVVRTVIIEQVNNQPPLALAGATPITGFVPLEVDFDSNGSTDPEGGILTSVWDFGDNSSVSNEANPTYTYVAPGSYTATLTVIDEQGLSSTDTVIITVNDSDAPVLNLLGHWTFDDGSGVNATDSSGNENTGTVNGATWSGGTLNGALDFDGTDDYVDLGNLDIPGNQLTISGWINADNFTHLTDHDAPIVSKAIGTAEQSYFWMLSSIKSESNTSLRFRLKTNDITTTLVGSSVVLTTNTWIHVAAVYDGSQMRLYQDGIEVGSINKIGDINQDSNVPVWIGRNPSGHGPFDGLIDDVQIHSRALSITEIAALANNSTSNQAPTATATATPTTGLAPLEVSFDSSGSSDPEDSSIAVEWGFGDSSVVSIEPSPTHSYASPGSYTATLTVTDTEGLTGTDTVIITVNDVDGINIAPTVDAGDDQTIALSVDATLDGTVNDDGLPTTPGAVTTLWTLISGPTGGTVLFADATQVDTTANFSVEGTYVLDLDADDSELASNDQITITVNAGGIDTTAPTIVGTISTTVTETTAILTWVTDEPTTSTVNYGENTTYSDTDNTDNVLVTNHSITLSNLTPETEYHFEVISSDGADNSATSADQSFTTSTQSIQNYTIYEDGEDGTTDGWIIYDQNPAGATITNVDDTDTASRIILFQGEGLQNGYRLGGNGGTPEAWNNASKVINWDMKFEESFVIYITVETTLGQRYLTYNQSSTSKIDGIYIINGLDNNQGTINSQWTSVSRNLESDLQVFEPTNEIISVNGFLVRGDGRIDNIKLPETTVNTAPTVDAGVAQTIALSVDATLDGTVSDDGLPTTPGTVTTLWTLISGPTGGTVLFADATQVDTTANFSVEGTYVLDLDADDSELTSNDQITITVNTGGIDTTAPTIVGTISTTVTETTAILTWVTDEPTTSTVNYGENTTYSDTDNTDNVLVTNHSITLSNLTPETEYHFEVISSDGADNSATSADQSFTTSTQSIQNYTIYEDGEDGTTDGWIIYDQDPAGATITNVDDTDTASRIILFQGEGLQNGYRLGGNGGTPEAWNNASKVINWDMKFEESFVIYITVETTLGQRYLTYNQSSTSKIDRIYIINGLDNNQGTINSQWTSVSRNLESDLQVFEPTNEIISVNGFLVRGDGRIDNIKLPETTVNTAPTVDAGVAQTIALSVDATLDGTVSDDGLPTTPGTVTTLWTLISGPTGGTVLFADATQVDTTANFSVEGTYVLDLDADDSELANNDQITITVNAGGADTTAPTIVGAISTTVTETTAILTWVTDELTTSTVNYGENIPYSEIDNTDNVLATNHSITLSNLTPETEYHFEVISSDGADNSATSADQSFTTSTQSIQNYTIYEDGEDGTTDGWIIYDQDPAGATITNVDDTDTASRIILFQGEGLQNGYRLGGNGGTPEAWNNASKVINWDMKFEESFVIYITVETTLGQRYLTYNQSSTSKIDGIYIINGLDNNQGTINSQWTSVSRNLESDLQVFEPTNEIISVNGFLVRGDGRIDNIKLPETTVNTAPTVDAGVAQTIALSVDATLDGTVSDDGLPTTPGAVTTLWTLISGPTGGTVLFADATQVDTTANFSVEGTYVLDLDADDSELANNDQITITVNAGGADTTAPTIVGAISTTVTDTAATITWTTDEPSTSVINYGESTTYTDSDTSDTTLVTDHSVTLSDLTTETIYHFEIVSTDVSTNANSSLDQTFTTAAITDITPPVVSIISTVVTDTTATITWTTNELSTSVINYGESTIYTDTDTTDATLVIDHSIMISSLTVDKAYHFEIVSIDGSGNSAASTDQRFTTAATADSQLPMAVISATSLSGIAPLTIDFDASSSSDPDGNITAYSWDFGDGNIGTGLTTSHTFNTQGTYNVTLTVTDNNNNTATVTTAITVDPELGSCVHVVDNDVLNGSFEESLSNWIYHNSGGGSASVSSVAPQHCDFSAKLDFTASGNNVQLYQRTVGLDANIDYNFSFTAKASTPRTIKVFLHKHTSPYNDYGLGTITANLTTEWQTFTYNFKSKGFTGSVFNGRLRFWLVTAQPGDTMFFDNIVIQKKP